ncbi:hypothetical protein IA539_16190 [Gordonia sp. zg691]|uniref:hypothetical protein n=1 Tax=Gordonia jinghuaiqii TaxID=2758710 RepID=UPI0016626EF2|nr:hypothetical protein [Gordonia jinghuaiqii]MBD0862732.1 hypothetical protein [Gordonia jinghuaiqii]
MAGQQINPRPEEENTDPFLAELKQINDNLNGLYTLLHDQIHLPLDRNHTFLMKKLDAIEERLGAIEGNTM